MLGVPPFTGSFFHQLDVSNTGGGVQFANWGNAIGNITVSTPVPVTVNGLSLGAQGDLTTAPSPPSQPKVRSPPPPPPNRVRSVKVSHSVPRLSNGGGPPYSSLGGWGWVGARPGGASPAGSPRL